MQGAHPLHHRDPFPSHRPNCPHQTGNWSSSQNRVSLQLRKGSSSTYRQCFSLMRDSLSFSDGRLVFPSQHSSSSLHTWPVPHTGKPMLQTHKSTCSSHRLGSFRALHTWRPPSSQGAGPSQGLFHTGSLCFSQRSPSSSLGQCVLLT